MQPMNALSAGLISGVARKIIPLRYRNCGTGNVQPSVAELLQIGLENQQAGRLNEAEFYYRAVLTAQPDRRVLGAFRRRISAYTSNLCMGSSPGGITCANDDPILRFNGTDFAAGGSLVISVVALNHN